MNNVPIPGAGMVDVPRTADFLIVSVVESEIDSDRSVPLLESQCSSTTEVKLPVS